MMKVSELLNEEVSEDEDYEYDLDEELGRKQKKRGRKKKEPKTKKTTKRKQETSKKNKNKKNHKEDDEENEYAENGDGSEKQSDGDSDNSEKNTKKTKKTKTTKKRKKSKTTKENAITIPNENKNNADSTTQTADQEIPKKKRKKSKKSENDADSEVVEEEKDVSKMPLKELIKYNAQKGKPTKAAVERQENRKKKKVNGTTDTPTDNTSEPSTNNIPSPSPSPTHTNASTQNPSIPTPNLSFSPAHFATSTPPNHFQQQPTRLDSLTSHHPAATTIAPQIKTDEHGNFILDEESMIYTTSEAPPQTESEVTEENLFITSSSFSSRTPSEKWSAAETTQFYSALRRYGTDFTLLEKLFASRTRKQLKNKFKREEREHPFKIEAALTNRIPINMDEYHKDITTAAEKRKQIQEKAQNQNANNPALSSSSSGNTNTQNTSTSTTTTTSTSTNHNQSKTQSIPKASTLGNHNTVNNVSTKISNTSIASTPDSEHTTFEDHSTLVFHDPVYSDINDHYDVAQYDEDYE